MGVLNVTPDSFSDGGNFLKPAAAVHRALQMEREGADLIDIGAESTRPGARPVSARVEIGRLRPALKRMSKKIKIPISVDTNKTEVAKMALDEGASLINDVSALRDRSMARLAAERKATVVLMHMKGLPRTMQRNPVYEDVCSEVTEWLAKAVRRALDAGISRERILIDPGFGFGKTLEHNLTLLRHLDRLGALRLPLLVGVSRKAFVGRLTGVEAAADRLYGSLAAAAAAVGGGAHVLRVHDVRAHKQLTSFVDRFFGWASWN